MELCFVRMGCGWKRFVRDGMLMRLIFTTVSLCSADDSYSQYNVAILYVVYSIIGYHGNK